MEETMKVKILSLFTVVAFALALCFSAATPAAPKTPATAAVSAAIPQPNAEPAAEPHPEIRQAIAALRRAKSRMEMAAHDFGGHRVEALKATDEAIHQLELCLKFDKD
jgi:hypothetical protein